MLARLDWEKAQERDRTREAKQAASPPRAAVRQQAARQAALDAFVEEHGIGCFKCGVEKAEWAKTGISKRGAWAICVRCVARET